MDPIQNATARQVQTWSPSAWIGSLVGGTLWMFLVGFEAIPTHLTAGLGVLGLAVVCNLVGLALWSRRTQLNLYLALELLLVPLAISAAIIFILIDKSLLGSGANMTPPWLPLLIFPPLLVLFEYRRRQSIS